MGSTSRTRLAMMVVAVALGVSALIAGVAPAAQPSAANGCPSGDFPGEQDRWQCVHECPGGTLYDGQSGVCVAHQECRRPRRRRHRRSGRPERVILRCPGIPAGTDGREDQCRRASLVT